MDERIEQIWANCTPETGMEDIMSERKAFDSAISTLRVNTQEAMIGLGGGDFGG